MAAGLLGLLTALVAIVLGVGALGAFFGAFFGGGIRSDKEYANRLKQALPGASAKIIELGNSSTSKKYSNMSVAMRLEVTPASGQPYQTISVWEIKPVHASEMQVGNSFPVKVDVINPKIIFPDLPWATQPDTIEFDEDDMWN